MFIKKTVLSVCLCLFTTIVLSQSTPSPNNASYGYFIEDLIPNTATANTPPAPPATNPHSFSSYYYPTGGVAPTQPTSSSSNTDGDKDDNSNFLDAPIPDNAIYTGNIGYDSPSSSRIYTPTFYASSDEYSSRLSSINSSIPLAYNSDVQAFINVYTQRKREVSERVLGLSGDLFPIFEQILAQYNIPSELKYLAIAESALSNNAVSRAGATGIWQFMRETGKRYNLEINTFIDERRDPYLATHAAARYLRDMYSRFGDWLLVIAAYNCGPGKVASAIRRSGGVYDYWHIRQFLPRETRSYVPSFIACAYFMNYYNEHNLMHSPPPFNVTFSGSDTVMVRQRVFLSNIAQETGYSVEELCYLNPSLRQKMVPTLGQPYTLRLPYDAATTFREKRQQIYAAMPEPVYYTSSTANGAAILSADDDEYTTQTNRISYTVRKGDNLSQIANKYGFSIAQIKKWNNISGSTIKVGQKLSMYKTRKVPVEKTIIATAPITKPATNLTVPMESQPTSQVWESVPQQEQAEEIITFSESINTDPTPTIYAPNEQNLVYGLFEDELPSEASTTGAIPEFVPSTITYSNNDVNNSVGYFADEEPARFSDEPAPASTIQAPKSIPVTLKPYVVKKGDSLYSIARNHPGNSVEDIKELNDIQSNNQLKAGATIQLIVP